MAEDTEIPVDIKHDIELAFNLYKNEYNKINKLKLRTLLFSFVMYKYSPSEINEYIESKTLKEKEFYSFDDVCDMVKDRLEISKSRDSDELFNYIVNDKNKNTRTKMTKDQLQKAFDENNIGVDEKEVDKMIEYIKRKQVDENEDLENEEEEQETIRKDNMSNTVSRNQFKQFYVEQK